MSQRARATVASIVALAAWGAIGYTLGFHLGLEHQGVLHHGSPAGLMVMGLFYGALVLVALFIGALVLVMNWIESGKR